MYLSNNDDVRSDGFAEVWEFHVLFPTLRAEGIWRLTPSKDGESTSLAVTVVPVPEPDTTEFFMLQISPSRRLSRRRRKPREKAQPGGQHADSA